MDKRNEFSVLADNQLEALGALLRHVPESEVETMISRIPSANHIFLGGCGRSRLVAEWFAVRLAQMARNVHVVGSATCPPALAGDLFLAISCSGDTQTTVAMARTAQQAGAFVIGITARKDSMLGSLSDATVLIPSQLAEIKAITAIVIGPSNNALFEQAALMLFDSVIPLLLTRLRMTVENMRENHTNLE